MFSPIRRSILYLALWRLDIDSSSSVRPGPAPPLVEARSQRRLRVTRHGFPAPSGEPAAWEGGCMMEGGGGVNVLGPESRLFEVFADHPNLALKAGGLDG